MSASPPPPSEVLTEFLREVVTGGADDYHGFVPVLRGSLLLHHWFGGRARPPADVDLECFDQPIPPGLDDDPDEFEREPGTFGRYGEFESRVDLGKAMCRIAVNHEYYGSRPPPSGITFFDEEDATPADGASLWTYGTPGRRYYAGWRWPGHAPDAGRVQIDLAEPGPYTPDALGVAAVSMATPSGPFEVPAYSREAMLAAKVSWLVRSLGRTADGVVWTGEPKDLFDAHLLATAGEPLRPDVFRRALLAVSEVDGLEWHRLGVLFEVRRSAVDDAVFANWGPFAGRHPKLVSTGPVALWQELADRLGPLLGDLDPGDAGPLLAALAADREAESPHLVYADWLDDHGHPDRAAVVRRVAGFLFRGETSADLPGLVAGDEPWLHHFFGTSARLRAFRQQAAGLFPG